MSSRGNDAQVAFGEQVRALEAEGRLDEAAVVRGVGGYEGVLRRNRAAQDIAKERGNVVGGLAGVGGLFAEEQADLERELATGVPDGTTAELHHLPTEIVQVREGDPDAKPELNRNAEGTPNYSAIGEPVEATDVDVPEGLEEPENEPTQAPAPAEAPAAEAPKAAAPKAEPQQRPAAQK